MSLPIRILFVCAGNICRSPAAEAIMQHKVKKLGWEDKFFCDSAGTVVYSFGENSDFRLREQLHKRGIEIESVTRRFDEVADFMAFHYILVMDEHNFNDLMKLEMSKKFKDRVYFITDFCKEPIDRNIPDPFAGGLEHFNSVLDVLEICIDGFLEKIKKELKL